MCWNISNIHFLEHRTFKTKCDLVSRCNTGEHDIQLKVTQQRIFHGYTVSFCWHLEFVLLFSFFSLIYFIHWEHLEVHRFQSHCNCPLSQSHVQLDLFFHRKTHTHTQRAHACMHVRRDCVHTWEMYFNTICSSDKDEMSEGPPHPSLQPSPFAHLSNRVP